MNRTIITLFLIFKLGLVFGQIAFTENYENGVIKVSGQLDQNDKKTGVWTYYYTNGKIRYKGSFKNDDRTGKWYFYRGNERLKETINYVDGKMYGEWNTYYNDSINTLKSTSYFKNGIGLGVRKEYYSNGKLKVYIEPDSLKKEVQIYNSYYQSGQKETSGKALKGEILKPGKKIGVWKIYFENGVLKNSIRYIENTDKYETKYYYENGNLKEKGIIKNKFYRIGEWKSYYKSGELESEILHPEELNYKSKKSIETFYLKDGNIKLKRFYNLNGKKEKEIKYENGKPIN